MTRLHDPWLRDRLDELAKDVGNLRKCGATTDWRIDRICDRVWCLLAATAPTAADRYRSSGDVEAALRETEEETLRLNRLLGAGR